MPFRTEFVSRVGGRAENQDACDFVEAGGTGCWVVADGLGGHRGGEIASRSAVEAVLTSFGKNPQLSEEALQRQTSDHSVVQVMADSGQLPREQIRHHEDRNRLLRCLGNPESDFRPTILSEPRALGANSAFLLCSDGFWENVLENEMVVDLAKSKAPAEWLTLMEDRLLERANDGNDNYTGLAIVSDEGIAP